MHYVVFFNVGRGPKTPKQRRRNQLCILVMLCLMLAGGFAMLSIAVLDPGLVIDDDFVDDWVYLDDDGTTIVGMEAGGGALVGVAGLFLIPLCIIFLIRLHRRVAREDNEARAKKASVSGLVQDVEVGSSTAVSVARPASEHDPLLSNTDQPPSYEAATASASTTSSTTTNTATAAATSQTAKSWKDSDDESVCFNLDYRVPCVLQMFIGATVVCAFLALAALLTIYVGQPAPEAACNSLHFGYCLDNATSCPGPAPDASLTLLAAGIESAPSWHRSCRHSLKQHVPFFELPAQFDTQGVHLSTVSVSWAKPRHSLDISYTDFRTGTPVQRHATVPTVPCHEHGPVCLTAYPFDKTPSGETLYLYFGLGPEDY